MFKALGLYLKALRFQGRLFCYFSVFGGFSRLRTLGSKGSGFWAFRVVRCLEYQGVRVEAFGFGAVVILRV